MAKKTTIKDIAKARRAREAKLLVKLQDDHGYSLCDVPKRLQVSMMMCKVAGKTTIVPMRCMKLYVPMDSTLALGLKKHDPKAERR